MPNQDSVRLIQLISKFQIGGEILLIFMPADLISSYTHTSEKLTNDVAMEYSQLRTRLSKVSLPEVFFVASGLVLALAALIFFQVYEAIWWAIKTRRVPKPLHVLSLIALSLLIYEFWP